MFYVIFMVPGRGKLLQNLPCGLAELNGSLFRAVQYFQRTVPTTASCDPFTCVEHKQRKHSRQHHDLWTHEHKAALRTRLEAFCFQLVLNSADAAAENERRESQNRFYGKTRSV